MMKTLKKAIGELNACRLLPLPFFIVLPVLLVRAKFLTVAPDAVAFWQWSSFGDTRSWWKAVFVVGIGAWMAAHAAARLASGWRPAFRRYGAATAAAMLLTLVSALLSDFPRTAWLGYTSLYEGACALLAYLAAAWYAAEMTETTESRLRLIRLVGCVGILEAVHGIFEGFGLNFWMTTAGRWLMGAGGAAPTFNFADSNMAYGTVFQPNHYGMLMAMLTLLALGMLVAENGTGWRIFWGLGFVLGFASVAFSNSRTALAVCVLLVAFCLLFSLAGALRKRRADAGGGRHGAVLALAGLLVCAACFAAVASGAVGAGRFGRAVRGLGGRIAGTFTPGPAYRLRSAELRNNAIELSVADDMFLLARAGRSGWTVREEKEGREARPLQFSRAKDGWSEAAIPGLERANLRVAGGGAVVLGVDGEKLWYFARGDALFAVDHKGLLYGERPRAAAASLGGLERYLGGRGQTWSRALALVRERPLFGAGPGGFALVFPNHEILMKQRYLDGVDEDKGHGVWATFLVQLGILGALPYGILIALVLWRRPWRHSPVGPALALALAAYLLGSVTNDSTLGVTPIFSVLTGLALSQTRPFVDTGE